jgi:hypothetical protein
MAAGKIPISTGSGLNVATYSITEGFANIELQRIVVANSYGTEHSIGSVTVTSVAGGWISATVASLPSITGIVLLAVGSSVTVSSTVTITGNVLVPQGVSINAIASVSLSSIATITGNVGVSNIVGGWASVTVASLPSITGSVTALLGNNSWTNRWAYKALDNTELTVWTPSPTTASFVITDMVVAATYAGTVTIKDGASGGTIMLLPLGANGGVSKQFRTPVKSLTAGNLLTATGSVTGGYILVCGYDV